MSRISEYTIIWGSSPGHEVKLFLFVPVYLPDGNFVAVAGSNFNYNIAGNHGSCRMDITSSDDFCISNINSDKRFVHCKG